MAFNTKTWFDGPEGNTPILAEDLNRIEAGISDAAVALEDPVNGSTYQLELVAGSDFIVRPTLVLIG